MAKDQNEVWSHFPKIASMGQALTHKVELKQAIDVLEKRLENVLSLRQELEAVKKSQEKIQDQVKESKEKLVAKEQLDEGASKVADKQPSHDEGNKASSSNNEMEKEVEVMDDSTSPAEEEVVTVANVAMPPEKPFDGYDSCYESGYDSCVESVRPNRVARTLIFR